LCTRTPSYSDSNKFIIIELKGTHEWLRDVEDAVHFEIDIDELICFFLGQFKQKENALMNLEYSLLERYALGSFGSISQDNGDTSKIILNKARNLGLKLLQHLEYLGFYLNNRLDYSFCRVISQDTFLLWRADNADVDRISFR
jgi:hypothetical protein